MKHILETKHGTVRICTYNKWAGHEQANNFSTGSFSEFRGRIIGSWNISLKLDTILDQMAVKTINILIHHISVSLHPQATQKHKHDNMTCFLPLAQTHTKNISYEWSNRNNAHIDIAVRYTENAWKVQAYLSNSRRNPSSCIHHVAFVVAMFTHEVYWGPILAIFRSNCFLSSSTSPMGIPANSSMTGWS